MRYYVTGAYIAALFCFYTSSAQVSLSVAPARLYFHSHSFQKTQKLLLHNTGNRNTKWTFSIKDWDRDSIGKKRYYDLGSQPHSCGNYISIAPSMLALPADGTAELTVSMNVDSLLSNDSVSSNAMLIISEVSDGDERLNNILQNQAGIIVKGDFAIHLYYINDKGNRNFEIINLQQKQDSIADIELTVLNTGHQPLDAKARLEISNVSTAQEWKLEPVSVNTLPGALRKHFFRKPVLPKGKYLAVAIVEAAGEMLVKVAELDFEIE